MNQAHAFQLRCLSLRARAEARCLSLRARAEADTHTHSLSLNEPVCVSRRQPHTTRTRKGRRQPHTNKNICIYYMVMLGMLEVSGEGVAVRCSVWECAVHIVLLCCVFSRMANGQWQTATAWLQPGG